MKCLVRGKPQNRPYPTEKYIKKMYLNFMSNYSLLDLFYCLKKQWLSKIILRAFNRSIFCITVRPRSLDPFYISPYYIKWIRNSWTYSIWQICTDLPRRENVELVWTLVTSSIPTLTRYSRGLFRQVGKSGNS